MRSCLPLVAVALLGCGPSIDATDGSSGGSGASGAAASSGAATADETGEAPPTSMQQIVYIASFGSGTPLELRSVRADGSDARALASSDSETSNGYVVGVREGLAFAYFDRSPASYVVYVDLEGTQVGIEPEIPSSLIWLHPHDPILYVLDDGDLERRPLAGMGERLGLARSPWFMSRSRRFVAVADPVDPLDEPALVDLAGELEPLPATFIEVPNDDPQCRSYEGPGYWFDEEETRAFVFPGPDSALLHVPLDDPGATQTVDVAAGFRPLGYDRCRAALIGRLPDGSVVTADHDGTIAALAPPITPSSYTDRALFSPSGNVMVTSHADAMQRTILVADLVAGSWISTDLPDSFSAMTLTAITEQYALVHTLDADAMPTSYRVTLASGELLPVPTCDDAGLSALTEAGQVLVCMDTDEGTVFGVQSPGEPMLPLGSNTARIHVLPSDPGSSSCVDTEPETKKHTTCT